LEVTETLFERPLQSYHQFIARVCEDVSTIEWWVLS